MKANYWWPLAVYGSQALLNAVACVAWSARYFDEPTGVHLLTTSLHGGMVGFHLMLLWDMLRMERDMNETDRCLDELLARINQIANDTRAEQ